MLQIYSWVLEAKTTIKPRTIHNCKHSRQRRLPKSRSSASQIFINKQPAAVRGQQELRSLPLLATWVHKNGNKGEQQQQQQRHGEERQSSGWMDAFASKWNERANSELPANFVLFYSCSAVVVGDDAVLLHTSKRHMLILARIGEAQTSSNNNCKQHCGNEQGPPPMQWQNHKQQYCTSRQHMYVYVCVCVAAIENVARNSTAATYEHKT